MQRHGAALHNIRHRTWLWLRRALQHPREPETPGVALRAEFSGGAQRVSDHYPGLSRVRATRRIRTAASPAETAADLHSESIVIHATSLRESAHHAAHVIPARRAPRSGCD